MTTAGADVPAPALPETAMLRAMVMTGLLLWPLAAMAANCEPEAQATERVVRSEGAEGPVTERSVGQARAQCRQGPVQSRAGRATLDETKRDVRSRPSPGKDQGGYRSPTLDPAWRRRND